MAPSNWFSSCRGGFREHFRFGKIAEFFEYILGSFDQFGALFDQFVTAAGDRRMNRTGNGKNLAALLGREAGGDQRTAFRGRFDDQHAARQAGNDPVATRESWRRWPACRAEIRKRWRRVRQSPGQFLVAGRVERSAPVPMTAMVSPPAASAPRWAAASMPSARPLMMLRPLPASAGEHFGGLQALRRGIAAADDTARPRFCSRPGLPRT
jgi:hypothetical protein